MGIRKFYGDSFGVNFWENIYGKHVMLVFFITFVLSHFQMKKRQTLCLHFGLKLQH